MTREPQPVYIVEPPEEPSLLRRFIWLPLVLAAGLAILSLTVGPKDLAQPPAGSQPVATPAATVDRVAVAAAANDVLNALQASITAQDVRCSSLSGKKYDACTAEYDRLSAQWDKLEPCLETVTSFEAITACEAAAGYKP